MCYTIITNLLKGGSDMSPVKEKFIEAIKALPYDIDEEILKKDTKDILQDVVQKYVDMYGIDDLSENDKECVQSLIGKI